MYLSFLSLIDSNFLLMIYRRPVCGNKTEFEYMYSLPQNCGNNETYIDYYISFVPCEGSTKHVCNSFDNVSMTLKWLSYQLNEKTNETLSKNEFFIGTNFIPRISYIIKKSYYGSQVVDVEPYYLRKKRIFGFLIDFRFVATPIYKFSDEVRKLSLSITPEGSKNKNLYMDKHRIIMSFITNTLPKLFPLQYSEGILHIKEDLYPIPCLLLNEKQYIFRNEKIFQNQFKGLSLYKPRAQPEKKPLFVFILQKNRVNVSRELVKALRGETYSTFSGMKRMFDVDFTNDKILSINVENYDKICLESIELQLDKIITDNHDHMIVGIFAGIQKDFDAHQEYSPYYLIKNIFLKRGLAIQAVTIEQMQKRDGLKWSISGIGLQLFVKLGGIPWIVVPQNKNCLIIGISSAHLKDSDGNIRKYFAYSVCFDSSGLYKRLDVLGVNENHTSYIHSLKSHVMSIMNEQIVCGITKCAIHVPYKLRKVEMEILYDCINEYKRDNANIEVVFIKINVNNRFFAYSNYNSKIPLSGTYMELSDREFLVWFEGLQQGKESVVTAKAVTNPVHIEFLRTENLAPDDIKGYLQDVINLSGANWRGYNAKQMPVSIYYPELIARFIGRFDQYGLEMNLGISAIDKAWFV